MTIVDPIFILGAPRSGTTILQRCLALHPDLWHLPGESHAVFEGPFHPAERGYLSNRVTANDVDEELMQQLRMKFYHFSINLNKVLTNPANLLSANTLLTRVVTKLEVLGIGQITRLKKPEKIRLLEKTPKNTLRVSMLNRLFPDAFYIWLKRRAANNIDSLTSGWHAIDRIGPFSRQRYARAGYPIADQLRLQDYTYKWWKFALVPEWQHLKGKTVADVAAWQYYQCNYFVLNDLANINPQRVFNIQYEDFVQKPVTVVCQIVEWANLPPSQIVESFANALPRVNTVSSDVERRQQGLRYPQAVLAAIEKLPEIQSLQATMGYDVSL